MPIFVVSRDVGHDAYDTTADRIATGRWSFGTNPIAAAQFAQNMQLYHARVTALAHAAEITTGEADQLWGADAEGGRRRHAVHLETYDELGLVNEWNSYATVRGDLAIPPYVPTDPDTGTPIAGGEVIPPTPQDMIAAAAVSLRAEFVDAAVGRDSEHNSTAITDAVDAALPEGEHTWEAEPDHIDQVSDPPSRTDLGVDRF